MIARKPQGHVRRDAATSIQYFVKRRSIDADRLSVDPTETDAVLIVDANTSDLAKSEKPAR
jgi:hypothetical protein